MKSRGGFTLLEITIALAVLMIVGVVLFAATGHNRDYRNLYNASRRLQADMRYAQRRAITEGRRIYIHFEHANNRYRLITRPGVHPISEFVYFQNGITFSLSGPFVFTGVGFLPRGTPVYPRTIYLYNGGQPQRPRYRQRITVIPSGGRTEVYPIIRLP